MSEVLGLPPTMMPSAPDLRAEVRQVLKASSEPLTLSKIRAHLPAAHRGVALEELAEGLQQLVDANVLYKYPPYRSPQDRYWDRPLTVHAAVLIREALAEGPLAWSHLRRKLPSYAVTHDGRAVAEEVLKDLVERGELHRHPTPGSRTGERYGVTPPDPKEPLRRELPGLFQKLETSYGFSRAQLRVAAISLLQEEEWGPSDPATVPTPAPAAVETLVAEALPDSDPEATDNPSPQADEQVASA